MDLDIVLYDVRKSRRLVTVGDDLMIEFCDATQRDARVEATSIEWTEWTERTTRWDHARDPAERKRRVVFVAVSLPRRVL